MVYQAHSALLGVVKWDHLSQARFTPRFSFLSVTVYSLDGILVFGLLFVCTCAYFKKVPRLKTWLLSEKKGVWGVFYKAAVIGTRLHAAVAIACIVMAFYVLFIK
uniref:Protein kish-B n=1 Tax=Equus asinus asinus TaxID=83772 RepID=A0A8C4KS59_EQUAS